MVQDQTVVIRPSGSRIVQALETDGDVERVTALARQGDTSALLSLIEHCKGPIMAAVARVRPPEGTDLDEAAHLARVQIFQKFADGFDGSGAPCAWMAVVARNRTRDLVRAEARHTNRAVSIDLVDESARQTMPSTERVENWDLVYRVLSQLSESDAELLTLHYLHGLTRHELADRLGYSYEGLRSKLNRACAKAHTILTEAEAGS